ncbi:MAG: hypothetical protein Q8N05_13210 [Bacteroidota bacterium]|nr:hypothetical protein [Bacteroidota bacterium]
MDENTKIKGENIGAIALKKGLHPVRIEYLEVKGNQRLRIYLKKNGAEDFEQVESGPFFH